MTSIWLATFKSHLGDGTLASNTLCVAASPWEDFDLEDPDMSEIADGIVDWLKEPYKQALATAWTLDEITVNGVLDHEGEGVTRTVGEAGELTLGSGALPKEICAIITFRTSYTHRSGRGRWFFPSPLRSSFLGNPDAWDPSEDYYMQLTALGDRINEDWEFDYGSGGLNNGRLQARVFSRVDSEAREITATIVRPRPHWLRSRSTSP